MMTRYFLCFLLGISLPASAQKIHLPVQLNHQWTFLEVNDKTTHLDETRLYDHLGTVNLPWFGQEGTQSGYYQVEQDGALGLVTASFEPVLRPAWREIHPISDQYFLVADANGYLIIDRKEQPLLRSDHYQAVKLKAAGSLSFFMLKQAGKWGVKKMGEQHWSIQPAYAELEFVDVGTEGLFKVKKERTAESKWQIINWQGSELPALSGTFDEVEAAGRNHLIVQETRNTTNWSIRDLTGQELLILDPETIIKPLNQYLFSYKEKGSETYAVLAMQPVITPLVEPFQYLQKINAELVFYRRAEKTGFIQSNGRLMPVETDQLLDVQAGTDDQLRVKMKTANKWGLYSLSEHRILQDCAYDSIAPFHGPFARVVQDDKIGLINATGKLIVPPRFEAIPYLEAGIDRVYGYWKDSVQVFSLDPAGAAPAEKRTAVMGPERYYWEKYGDAEAASEPSSTAATLFPELEKDKQYWQEMIAEKESDTLWVEAEKRYWRLEAGNYQLMQWDEVEVVVREKSASTNKKKKKKSKKKKKPTPPAPKKTELVMKWVAKGAPVKFLRKASDVDWTLVYQDQGGLVSNELTDNGKTKFSVRKINIFRNDTNAMLSEVEMTGIRLSDFANGLPYAAFMDLDGKIGLIDKVGEQATDTEGKPLRFTYISKAAEGKMRVCHEASAFSQLGLDLVRLFEEFNAELVSGTGNYTSEIKSNKQALWAYINSQGELLIPFEYELAAPFKNKMAINKKGGKWGAINADNVVVIPFEYEAIVEEKGNWKVVKGGGAEVATYYDSEGTRYEREETAALAVAGHRLFPFELNGDDTRLGYADKNGTVVIAPQFEYASKFYDGLATVRIGRKWFFINEMGREVVSMDTSIIGIIEVGNFSEGLCPIRKTTILNKKPTRKYGYLNLEGQLAIPPIFDGAGMFQDDLAIVDSLNLADYRPGKEGGIPRDLALIDRAGNLVTDYEFRRIGSFNEAGFAEVIHAKTSKQGIIDKNGRLLTGNYYERVKSFKDGVAVFDGTSWKVFDYTGNEIGLPAANIVTITDFADHQLVVKDQLDNWLHLVVAGSKAEIKQGDLQFLQPFDHGYALARIAGQNRLYGQNQSWVQPDVGQFFKSWSGNLIGVKAGASEFFANLALQNVFARTFDSINDFVGNCAVVNYKGQSGVINRNGLFIVPPKFKAISREKAGYLKVQVPSRRYGLWSSEGEEIVPAKYDAIRYLDNGIICVEDGDFLGYYRGNGEVLWELGE